MMKAHEKLCDALDKMEEIRLKIKLLSVLLSSADKESFDDETFLALSSYLLELENELLKSAEALE
ncbi:hypothetical protein [Hydrogenimonas thermophila]|uniref:Uncharacterized protein n=1 Tax=Hydrogenimonas thermophila TaxID=223786 RepID=A0A1I5RRF4_9BACT|nr:hypothetical protein [Hydrogenimonas thermophila]SFP61124.1 hypothetical protein SAMN05216234_12829 [Hydrogenimonas thermophila]